MATATTPAAIAAMKPGTPSFPDEAALTFVIIRLFNDSADEMAVGASKISNALDNEGVTRFYDEFMTLSKDDIDDLTLTTFAGHTKGNGASAPYNDPGTDPLPDINGWNAGPLPKMLKRRIKVVIAYVHHKSAELEEIFDIRKLDKNDFDTWRISSYSPDDPIVPYKVAIKRSHREEFAKLEESPASCSQLTNTAVVRLLSLGVLL